MSDEKNSNDHESVELTVLAFNWLRNPENIRTATMIVWVVLLMLLALWFVEAPIGYYMKCWSHWWEFKE